MTGPEHYREAERIIREATSEPFDDTVAAAVAIAQVHATLALAAATANDRLLLPQGDGTQVDVLIAGDAPTWAEVTA